MPPASKDSITSFIAGFFVGRLTGRRAGISVLLLMLGLCACCSALSFGPLGTPAAIGRAWQVSRLPRPTTDALATVAPGTALLLTGQLRASDAAPLAARYVEQSISGTWRLAEPGPAQIVIVLGDRRAVTVALDANTQWLNTTALDQSATRRWMGYAPDQALTVEGVWQSDGSLTGRALYAGLTEAYIDYVNSLPGTSALMALACSAVAVVLLVAVIGLRIFGK